MERSLTDRLLDYFDESEVESLPLLIQEVLARIAELDERDRLLTWLENGGVDNWEGYEISIKNGREMDDD